jgi:hypothetical protein
LGGGSRPIARASLSISASSWSPGPACAASCQIISSDARPPYSSQPLGTTVCGGGASVYAPVKVPVVTTTSSRMDGGKRAPKMRSSRGWICAP